MDAGAKGDGENRAASRPAYPGMGLAPADTTCSSPRSYSTVGCDDHAHLLRSQTLGRYANQLRLTQVPAWDSSLSSATVSQIWANRNPTVA